MKGEKRLTVHPKLFLPELAEGRRVKHAFSILHSVAPTFVICNNYQLEVNLLADLEGTLTWRCFAIVVYQTTDAITM